LAYSIHLHHLTEILSQPRSASRILSRSRSFHFLGWDRPISFLPGKRGSELTLDPYSFLVLHRFSRPRVNWTRIHLLGKREWIRLRLRLRIGHRTD